MASLFKITQASLWAVELCSQVGHRIFCQCGHDDNLADGLIALSVGHLTF